MVILEHLVVTDSTIYAIGLAKSYASYTLHVTALSAETGDLLTAQNIPSSIENGPDDFFALPPSTSEDPRLVWVEKGVVKSIALTPKLAKKPQSLRGSTNTKILDVGLSEQGLFVVKREDGSASVFRLNQNTIELTWDFADLVSPQMVASGLFTEATAPRRTLKSILIQCIPGGSIRRETPMLEGCTGPSLSKCAVITPGWSSLFANCLA